MRQSRPTVIRIDQDRLLKWLIAGLVATALGIVLLDALISEYELASIGATRRFFNITREDGIANFFSSIQFVAVAFVLLLITLVVRNQTRGTGQKVVVGWALITCLFLLLGIDDGTKMHERLGSIFKALVTDSSGDPSAGFLGTLHDSFPSYSWQFIVGPFYVGAGLFLMVFLMKVLDSHEMRALALMAAAWFAIAQGMDFLEGLDDDPYERVAELFSTSHGRAVHFSKSIEEFLEMVGTTMFLFIFLKKLGGLTHSLTFEIDAAGEDES